MNAIVKTVAVIAGAQILKFGIIMLIGKAAEREEKRLRHEKTVLFFDARKK
jgi:hypothetical protein